MAKYNPQKIEPKWQARWEKDKAFRADDSSKKEKFYCLDMFPYPSSHGLHVGHPEGYTATDIISRYQRMQGKEVLHTMGWDAFGLPAENFAIKSGVHPMETTTQSIKTFRQQIKSLGFSYDWEREVNTSSPEYYRWTQWIFLQLYKNGLAYKKKAAANWCESCKTVLANEQVIDGKCERCKNEVEQRDLKQWFFKVTDYAERLLDDLDNIDWPESIKLMQRNWIGKSTGCDVSWKVKDQDIVLDTFTTTVDTIYGVTFAVISPEHSDLAKLIKPENKEEAEKYIDEAKKKPEIDRLAEGVDKTGVFTGSYLVHPFTSEDVPLWIADYVLMSYGTGVVMGVPAHDKRDYDFAQKYDFPIVQSVTLGNGESFFYDDLDKYNVEGKITDSGEFTDMSIIEGRKKIIDVLEKKNAGQPKIQYKLRDWLISRQRYWGAPIPIIYCNKCGEVPVPEDQLPVKLPTDVDFKPTGESPLKDSQTFHEVECPKCGAAEGVTREVDTMDTFVCSSWYFLRYCDSQNDKVFVDNDKLAQWMPVDLYVGGAEHACLHLIYARFFYKVLKDLGYIKVDSAKDHNEPFQKLKNQGMILGEDHQKMSKSRGNVVNPDDVISVDGADTLRLYEMFMGAFEDVKPWDMKSIRGVRRFLDRVWDLREKVVDYKANETEQKVLHQTIKKVT
ncbi:MAG: leucine--tRNA ligase, partial [Parcubacteria group bacterium]